MWSVGTYKTLEPGPYWPEMGQAQTTCRGSVVVAFLGDERSGEVPAAEVRRVRTIQGRVVMTTVSVDGTGRVYSSMKNGEEMTSNITV